MLYQDGEPGPPERLQVFIHFLAKTDYQHLKPERGTEKLTTDHCFVQSNQLAMLKLIDNASWKIETDHRYTLHLTLGRRGPEPIMAPNIKCFRVSQLSKRHIQEAMLDLISRSTPPFTATDDIDEINTKLVQFCQQVQENTIGYRRPPLTWTPQSMSPSVREQTVTASIHLYKHASQSSQENSVIFPTQEAMSQGIDAATENLAILQERWSGRPFQVPPMTGSSSEAIAWTREQVVEEIQEQEAEKSCGADGMHIRFLKAVQETAIITWLQELYNRCLREGRTPRAWNDSEVYLLTKDVSRRRDATNLRPISIISISRLRYSANASNASGSRPRLMIRSR